MSFVRRSILGKLVAVLVLVLASVVSGKSQAPEPVLDARASSVMLGQYNTDGIFVRYCSGALVDDRVVTAGHCVDGHVFVDVQMYDGYVYTGRVLRAARAWPAVDYAVIELPIARGLYPSLELGDGLEYGEDLYAWSGPWGVGTLLLEGSYAGRISDDLSIPGPIRGMHYTTMNAAGGSSGSLVLNEDGEAEAILVGAFGEDSRTLRLVGSLLVDLP